MSAPQEPRRRQWQKKRRTKKLNEWRAKKAAAQASQPEAGKAQS